MLPYGSISVLRTAYILRQLKGYCLAILKHILFVQTSVGTLILPLELYSLFLNKYNDRYDDKLLFT